MSGDVIARQTGECQIIQTTGLLAMRAARSVPRETPRDKLPAGLAPAAGIQRGLLGDTKGFASAPAATARSEDGSASLWRAAFGGWDKQECLSLRGANGAQGGDVSGEIGAFLK